MYKGYANSLKKNDEGNFSFPSVEPVKQYQDALTVHANQFMRLVGSDAAEAGSDLGVIVATAHAAARGDTIRITSGTEDTKETKVIKVSANAIYIADPITLSTADTFEILRHKVPRVNDDGAVSTTATLVPEPILFTLDGADQEVTEDTGTPANSRPLPVKPIDANGNVFDFATSSGQDDIIAEIQDLAAVDFATSAKQDTIIAALGTLNAKDFATSTKQDAQTALLTTINAKDFATQTTLAAVLAKIIAAPSTEAKQDDIITQLTTLNAKDFATQTTLAAILAKIIAAPATEAKQDALIALVPGSLGQKTKANSFAVTLASDQDALPTTPTGNSYADSVRNDYSSVNVTTGAWVELIASTAAAAKGLTLFDSSGQTLELGVGGGGSEARKLIVPPGGLNGFIPLAIPAGSRLSIRAISANATVGEIDITLLG